jgi:hypothetical protein
MRLRHCLLVTSLLAGTVTAATGQDPDPASRAGRRHWIRLEPLVRRPMMESYRLRMGPERMRMVERVLDRVRVRTQSLSRDRLERMRERELAVRERFSDRMNTSLRRSMVERERAMGRVRERLDRMRDEHRVLRRRWRTI